MFKVRDGKIKRLVATSGPHRPHMACLVLTRAELKHFCMAVIVLPAFALGAPAVSRIFARSTAITL